MERYRENQTLLSLSTFDSKQSFRDKVDLYNGETTGPGIVNQDSSSNNDTVSDNEGLVETPNQMQGFWSDATGRAYTTQDLLDMAQAKYGDLAAYTQAFGISPTAYGTVENPYSADKWLESDGVGSIMYNQGQGQFAQLRQKVVEPASISTIESSGCGTCALSAVFSTMLHRYITPAEVAVAISTVNERYGYRSSYYAAGITDGAINQVAPLNHIINDMKYNGKQMLQGVRGNFDKATVIDTLNKGGMIIWVSSGNKNYGPYWGIGGHWVVIREYNSMDDTFLCFDSLNTSLDDLTQNGHVANPNTPSKWEVLYNACKSKRAAWYITPAEGYTDYINSVDTVNEGA